MSILLNINQTSVIYFVTTDLLSSLELDGALWQTSLNANTAFIVLQGAKNQAFTSMHISNISYK